jgi:hypothetical protein
MVGIQSDRVTLVPFHEVYNVEKKVSREFIDLAMILSQ